VVRFDVDLPYVSNLNYTFDEEPENLQINQRLLSDDPEMHRVTSLPGLVGESLVHYAGYITVVPSKGSNIFYWLFETPKNPLNAPLLIWLNGGPGCSSMDGLFLELGPLRIEGQNVKINQYSWHNAANIIFIDQPVGTGLSFTNNKFYATNDEMINEQFYTFLVEFLKLHSRYMSYNANGQKISRKIFFSGESHAGHYIPSMAAYIQRKNQKLTSKEEIYLDIAGSLLKFVFIFLYFKFIYILNNIIFTSILYKSLLSYRISYWQWLDRSSKSI